MKKYLGIFLLLITFVLFNSPSYAGRRCTGSANCTACSNCNGCKYCNDEGGTCGVCSVGDIYEEPVVEETNTTTTPTTDYSDNNPSTASEPTATESYEKGYASEEPEEKSSYGWLWIVLIIGGVVLVRSAK